MKVFLLSLQYLRGRKINLPISFLFVYSTECLNCPVWFISKKVWHRPFVDISEINAQKDLFNFYLIKRYSCFNSGE